MKEYKTLKVGPEDETTAIQCYETFGWKLEETREVYNESQEVLGVSEKVTSYGSFMRGFTGNDGKIESQVKTQTNITHFLSMRFSRETTMKNYNRLSDLQKEYDSIEYEPYYDLPKKPIKMTILGIFGVISIMLPLGAIIAWISYSINKKKVIKLNAKADEINPKKQARIREIIAEASKLVEESKAA